MRAGCFVTGLVCSEQIPWSSPPRQHCNLHEGAETRTSPGEDPQAFITQWQVGTNILVLPFCFSPLGGLAGTAFTPTPPTTPTFPPLFPSMPTTPGVLLTELGGT